MGEDQPVREESDEAAHIQELEARLKVLEKALDQGGNDRTYKGDAWHLAYREAAYRLLRERHAITPSEAIRYMQEDFPDYYQGHQVGREWIRYLQPGRPKGGVRADFRIYQSGRGRRSQYLVLQDSWHCALLAVERINRRDAQEFRRRYGNQDEASCMACQTRPEAEEETEPYEVDEGELRSLCQDARWLRARVLFHRLDEEGRQAFLKTAPGAWHPNLLVRKVPR